MEKPLDEYNLEGKRIAVAIGINEYERSTTKEDGSGNGNIPPLKGAENDAKELAVRLKNYGNFDLEDDPDKENCTVLIGKHATFERIRGVISDIFWKDDLHNIVLFYFSGHGFVDGYGNPYIAPYDMIKDGPFRNGINMKDLNRIIKDYYNVDPKNRKVVVILDCCHSDSFTEPFKTLGDSGEHFVGGFNELRGNGRLVIASTDNDEKAREDHECMDENNSMPHPHGVLTSHLLHGLEGGSDKRECGENGIITFANLMKFVNEEMVGKQMLRIVADGDPGILQTQFAVAPKKYKDSISRLIQEAREYFSGSNMHALNKCAKNVFQVIKSQPTDQEADLLKQDIEDILNCFRRKLPRWLSDNEGEFSAEFEKSARGQSLYDTMLDLESYLTFESFVDINPVMLCLFHKLSRNIHDKEIITVKKKRDSFIRLCVSCMDLGHKPVAP